MTGQISLPEHMIGESGQRPLFTIALLFDMSEGECRFKTYFGSERKECVNVYYFRKTIFNFLLILTHMMYTKIHRIIAKIVLNFEFNKKTKKFFETTIG